MKKSLFRLIATLLFLIYFFISAIMMFHYLKIIPIPFIEGNDFILLIFIVISMLVFTIMFGMAVLNPNIVYRKNNEGKKITE